MKEMKCEVIRDLLPLYADDAANGETRELVEKHLAECPACREELRKMRAPIPLLPDEDEKLLKQFQEQKRQLRRKRKIRIICAASIVAAIILYCLSYTLIPKSWAELNIGQQIKSLSGICLVTGELSYLDPSDAESGTIYTYNSYRLDQVQGDHPAAQAIASALEGHSYRADLINLRLIHPDRISVVGADSLNFYLRTEKRFTGVTIYSNGQLIWGGISGHYPDGVLSYRTDTGLFQEVLEVLQEYGILEQDVIKPQ